MAALKFYSKPTCSTCRNAKSWLRAQGAEFEEIDLNQGLKVEQLDRLIGRRDYRAFLNSRNQLYRERKMKDNPPSRTEALELMAQHPNLIKRPILVKGGEIVLGFQEDEMKRLL
jgi:arsenate reductase